MPIGILFHCSDNKIKVFVNSTRKMSQDVWNEYSIIQATRWMSYIQKQLACDFRLISFYQLYLFESGDEQKCKIDRS